jgi:hypothetical protein
MYCIFEYIFKIKIGVRYSVISISNFIRMCETYQMRFNKLVRLCVVKLSTYQRVLKANICSIEQVNYAKLEYQNSLNKYNAFLSYATKQKIKPNDLIG